MTNEKKKAEKVETDKERRDRRTREANEDFKKHFQKALEDDEADRKHEVGEKDDDEG